MASSGYTVTFSDMNAAMAAYMAQARAISAALETFKPEADLEPGAFGKVSGSASMATEYAKLYAQIIDQVTTMSRELAAGGMKIGLACAHYQAAEQASTIHQA